MVQQAHSTPGAPEVIADRLALVYDTDGRILHHHRVTTLQGGRRRTDEEVREAALEHARKCSRLSSEAAVLLVEPQNLVAGHRHRVDVQSKSVISEPQRGL